MGGEGEQYNELPTHFVDQSPGAVLVKPYGW